MSETNSNLAPDALAQAWDRLDAALEKAHRAKDSIAPEIKELWEASSGLVSALSAYYFGGARGDVFPGDAPPEDPAGDAPLARKAEELAEAIRRAQHGRALADDFPTPESRALGSVLLDMVGASRSFANRLRDLGI